MTLLSYSGSYTRNLLRRHPDVVFLFGDNLVRAGKGGQAIIRDEQNAFGIPTKRLPTNDEGAFFTNGDCDATRRACHRAAAMARTMDVVVPVTPEGKISLGLGLADLPNRAPAIYDMICYLLVPTAAFEPNLGFDEDHTVGESRHSVKRSHRAEGRNWVD